MLGFKINVRKDELLFKSIIRFLKTNRKIKEYIDAIHRFPCHSKLQNAEYVLTMMIRDAYYNCNFSFSMNLLENFLFATKTSEKYKNSVIGVAVFNPREYKRLAKPTSTIVEYDVVGVDSDGLNFITPSGFEIPVQRVVTLNGKKFDIADYRENYNSFENKRRIRDCVLNMTMDEVVEHIKKDKLNYIKEN